MLGMEGSAFPSTEGPLYTRRYLLYGIWGSFSRTFSAVSRDDLADGNRGRGPAVRRIANCRR